MMLCARLSPASASTTHTTSAPATVSFDTAPLYCVRTGHFAQHSNYRQDAARWCQTIHQGLPAGPRLSPMSRVFGALLVTALTVACARQEGDLSRPTSPV